MKQVSEMAQVSTLFPTEICLPRQKKQFGSQTDSEKSLFTKQRYFPKLTLILESLQRNWMTVTNCVQYIKNLTHYANAVPSEKSPSKTIRHSRKKIMSASNAVFCQHTLQRTAHLMFNVMNVK